MELGVSVSRGADTVFRDILFRGWEGTDRNFAKNLKERDYLQDLEVYDRTILEKEESATLERYGVQP